MDNNCRIYGDALYSTVLIHGGPGAGGEMAPVARELAKRRGILEPLQTADSIKGQIDELRTVIEENADSPVTLIGYSWGAWLSCLFAVVNPSLVKRLILISGGGFEEKYGAKTQELRLSRLSPEEKDEIQSLFEKINDPATENQDDLFEKFGALFSKADNYDPLPPDTDEADNIDFRPDVFQSVWGEAAELRRSGRLLKHVENIHCPVTAIHGDYDPHPAIGVEEPLSAILQDFRFITLSNCGHKPWIEREAKERFYEILEEELGFTINNDQ